MWVERWGPAWLELLGADRFRRHIVGVVIGGAFAQDMSDERTTELLTRMRRFHRLRSLALEIERLTPSVAEALHGMPQLRSLSITQTSRAFGGADEQIVRTCLMAIGRMTNLEDLSLEGILIESENLRLLAGLSNLKWLELHSVYPPGNFTIDTGPVFLEHLPALPRLKTLCLPFAWVGNRDLPNLSTLPSLKTLNLWGTEVDDAGLVELARSRSLEQLAIAGTMVTARGLRSLRTVKRLKGLHLDGWNDYTTAKPLAPLSLDKETQINIPQDEVADFREALRELRRGNPGIVIDDQAMSLGYGWSRGLEWSYDTMPHRDSPVWSPRSAASWLPAPLRGRVEANAIRDGITNSF